LDDVLLIVPAASVTFDPESVNELAPEAKLRFVRLRLEIVFVFEVPIDPAKTSVLPLAFGAVPEAQFVPVLQFVLPPPPSIRSAATAKHCVLLTVPARSPGC